MVSGGTSLLFKEERREGSDSCLLWQLSFFHAVFSGSCNKDGVTSIGRCHRVLGLF